MALFSTLNGIMSDNGRAIESMQTVFYDAEFSPSETTAITTVDSSKIAAHICVLAYDSHYVSYDSVRAILSNTQLTAYHETAVPAISTNTYIAQIPEFIGSSIVSLQTATKTISGSTNVSSASLGAGSSSCLNATITAVDTSKAVVFPYGVSSNAPYVPTNGGFSMAAVLTSSTNCAMFVPSNGSSTYNDQDVTTTARIAEFQFVKSVQRVDIYGLSGPSTRTKDHTINAVEKDYTVIMVHLGRQPLDGADTNEATEAVLLDLTSSTNLRASIGDDTTKTMSGIYVAQVIELIPSYVKSIQKLTGSSDGLSSLDTVSILGRTYRCMNITTDEVDLTKTMVFSNGFKINSGGNSGYIPALSAYMSSSTNCVVVLPTNSVLDVDVQVQVVEFK